VLLHQLDQARQAVTGHDAVGVEHDHVAVVRAPSAAEVGHVAGLAFRAVLAPAVVDARGGAVPRQGLGQLAPGNLLGGAQVGLVGVAQHEEVEAIDLAGARERLVGCTQAAEHGRHILIADRHDHGSARSRVDLDRALPQRVGHGATVVSAQQHPRTHHTGPEAG
jgi:hypothetical protein